MDLNMLPTMRKQAEERRKQMKVSGTEIYIPTRAGQARCLIYKPVSRKAKYVFRLI